MQKWIGCIFAKFFFVHPFVQFFLLIILQNEKSNSQRSLLIDYRLNLAKQKQSNTKPTNQ